MNADANWLRQRTEELRDATRQARWQLAELQAARAEIAPVWSDRCASDMAARYLAPLSADAAQALTELDRQAELLAACAQSLAKGGEAAEETHEAAREVRRLIDETETVFRVTNSIANEVLARAAESGSHVARACDFLASAEAAGSEE